MTLTLSAVIALLAASVLTLALLLVLLRRRPLVDRRLVTYCLGAAIGVSLLVAFIMIEALLKIIAS